MALRDEWKKTGKGLGHAFRDLGKSIVRSVKTGVDKADEWASSDDAKPEEAPKAEDAPKEE